MSFTEFRAIYPPRVGSQRWGDAERAYAARLREGCKPEEILEGVRRYVRFLKAVGKERTEYVQQAASFVGRNKGFLEDWTPPNQSGSIPNMVKMPTVEEIREAEAAKAAREKLIEAVYEARRLGLEPQRVNEPNDAFCQRVKKAVTEEVLGRYK